jgi:hypothetical protein
MTTRPGYIWSGTEWVAIGQEAVLAPISYQTSAPSTPATGDVWIDSDDDVPSVNSTLYYRWKKTATGGETSFTGTDDNSLTLAYTAGYESVFINGVLQVRGSDYTATTGTSITGLTALTAGDIVMVESVMAYSVGDTYTQSVSDGKFSPITTTGLVLVASATIGTAVSSVVVNNAFSSTYENYKIFLSGGTASTDTSIQMKLGSTTSGYGYSLSYLLYSGTSGILTSASAANFPYIGFSKTDGSGLNCDIISPFLSKPTYVSGLRATYDAASFFGGWVNNSTSYTDFTLTPASGTITGGTIKVYGYK